ncbi:MAG: ThiF family adenylyltransferase [Candidatus Heimdallarchaeota archaeon]|nr:MAG: ThiF family adenylyltransferase [Candidatus Heimdallarchaeota archaeon]
MLNLNNRNIRYKELIPEEKLNSIQATVVGVGAIGRQVVLQLAAIGVPHISIIDFDTVGVENLGTQGFHESDIGRFKVDAVSDICRAINSKININPSNTKFRPIQFIGGILFCCVDRIDTRKSIYNAIGHRCDLFVDGRMSAEYLRVLSAFDDKSREYYLTTLFPQQEAYVGSCTAQTTIYCANIAAGFMVAQFIKWLRGCNLDMDVDINLLTNEMGVHQYEK